MVEAMFLRRQEGDGGKAQAEGSAVSRHFAETQRAVLTGSSGPHPRRAVVGLGEEPPE